jgi:drug/metabolite transporter (DMT)-like permease
MLMKQETIIYSFLRRPKVAASIGPLLMLASAFLFAVMDCLIKFLSPSFRVWDIAFYRFGCGMAILLLLFSWRQNPFESRNRTLLLARGVAGSLAFLAFVIAIRLIPISTALVLFYAYPAFAVLFSALLFKEKLTKDLIWVLAALGGVALVLDPGLEGGVLGQAVSLLGAAFAGVAVATIRKARETNGPVIIYLYFCLTGVMMTVVPFASDPQLPATAHEWLIVVGIVGVSLLAQLLMNEGFHYCTSCEGGLLLTTEVLFVAFWGIAVLHETVTWHFWSGGIMILGSIVALNRSIIFSESKQGFSPEI